MTTDDPATDAPSVWAPRRLPVPARGAGMRLDRFLARRFRTWTRSTFSRHIRAGRVQDQDGRTLRASHTVRDGQVLLLFIPGLAAMGPPPPFPAIAHEDERVAVVVKPPGMMCHPAGDRHVYALIGLVRQRWPQADLVHRIDKDTSGLVCISKDTQANIALKASFRSDETHKVYQAIVRGAPGWEELEMRGGIGPAEGPVRIQMAVRDEGLASYTHARVLGRRDSPVGPLARLRCRITTGRTHQIRVHLGHAGLPLLGDRLYGPRCEVFLEAREHGLTDDLIREVGAPRHALHSAELRVPHPSGGTLEVSAPLFEDMDRWWRTPQVLPLDRAPAPDPCDPGTAGVPPGSSVDAPGG